MLFKFKSQAASDLIMLEADARRLLKICLGDDPVKGIVSPSDLPQAIAALEWAVAQEALSQKQNPVGSADEEHGDDLGTLPKNTVSLAQRAAPMLKLFKRCLAEQSDVVWGV